MDIYDLYERIGGNYDDVKRRISSDSLIKRFCLGFLNDNSFLNLKNAIINKNYKEAFFAVHTLKGVCLNLSFTNLANRSSELTEYLRNYQDKQIDDNVLNELFLSISDQYEITIDAIQELNA